MVEYCEPLSSQSLFTLNTGLHCVIIFVFWTAFYTFYVYNLSNNAFENEISGVIDSSLGGAIDMLTPIQKANAGLVLSKIPLNNLIRSTSEPDKSKTLNNKWIKIMAFVLSIISILMWIGSIFILSKSCNKCIPLTHIIFENVVVFICVGVIEYIFFTHVASHFVPAPPSLLVSSFLERFKASLVSKTM